MDQTDNIVDATPIEIERINSSGSTEESLISTIQVETPYRPSIFPSALHFRIRHGPREHWSMSATSYLDLENTTFLHTSMSYLPSIVALFNASDFKSEANTDPDEPAEFDFYGYETTVEKLRERFTVLGISKECAISEVEKAIFAARQVPANEAVVETSEKQDFPSEIMDVAEISRRIKARLKWDMQLAFKNVDEGDGTGDFVPPEYEDPRIFYGLSYKHHLRFFIDLCETPEALVQMNLTDLKADNRCDPVPENLVDLVKSEHQAEISVALPLLVVTEGKSDSKTLSAAMEITHPHLVGYINFMEFSYNAEGSATNVARTIRAMAAAGIPNRMVGLLDNDLAGREEIDKVSKSPLPPNARMIQYPELDDLRSYPTHAFDGEIVHADVNGSAGSLELYFGNDVLTKEDGSRYPVRWEAYKEKFKTYQGVVEEKSVLQKRFLKKVEDQKGLSQADISGDWEGISAIISSVVHAFDS